MTYNHSTIEFIPKPTHGKFQDLEGQIFNRLTVIGFGGRRNLHTYWFCKCLCGTIKNVAASPLKNGDTQSCGCWHKERVTESKTIHGESANKISVEYRSYTHAKNRCNNPKNAAFAHYGNRGIKFRFNSFEDFLIEVGRRPSSNHTLDRIDVNGHYEKGNLRWVTWDIQQQNRRNNHCIEVDGIRAPIAYWAKHFAIKATRLYHRLAYGWCVNCAIHNPYRQSCSHQTVGSITGVATKLVKI